MSMSGPLLFASFAYPPNALGYCGPADSLALLEQVSEDAAERGLRDVAERFEGAWPYLQLIAAASSIADPLDRRVVEAYWVGNQLLDRVDPALLIRSLDDRFEARMRCRLDLLASPVVHGARPHHNFHVFAVYPWLGLIRSGVVDQPLQVLDRCRIRCGRVVAVLGEHAVVRTRPLRWDGRALVLGEPADELATWSAGGLALTPQPTVGGECALHWDWLCSSLSPAQADRLRSWTGRVLAAVNASPVPAPAVVLS